MNRDRSNARALAFLESARLDGRRVTADSRVGLKYATKLAGLSYGHMRQLIGEGNGPRVCRLGMGADKLTVSLIDLAEWIERRFEV